MNVHVFAVGLFALGALAACAQGSRVLLVGPSDGGVDDAGAWDPSLVSDGSVDGASGCPIGSSCGADNTCHPGDCSASGCPSGFVCTLTTAGVVCAPVGGTGEPPTHCGAADPAKELSPDLQLPPGEDETCGLPGGQDRCAVGAACRIATPTGGRCESCGPCQSVGNPCTASSQCDLFLQCFKGQCAELCPLGSSLCHCVDVGNATHGICQP